VLEDALDGYVPVGAAQRECGGVITGSGMELSVAEAAARERGHAMSRRAHRVL